MADPERELLQGAPEGARCKTHRERQAHYTCPRCESHVCIACFHPAVRRCEICLRSDPTAAAAPIPFETKDGSALGRYLATFATAFRPTRSAPAFARPEVGAARTFFLLSALPLVLLAGIVPHTRTLVFGNGVITVFGSPSSIEIALDVVRAMGAQLALSSVELLALYLPFVSLVRDAAAKGATLAATRVLLYRFWLSPAAALLGYLAAWLLPMPELGLRDGAAPPALSETWPLLLVSLSQVTLRVLQIIAMSATARLACGLTMTWTFVAVLVPLVLQILVVPLAADGLELLLPKPPELPQPPQLPSPLPSTTGVT